MLEKQVHPILPEYDQESEILILGSFPSPKSREVGFFYGHPQNRFWLVMENLYHVELNSIEDKKAFLHTYHIALWDTIKSCEIDGAKDSSIRNVEVNDIQYLLNHSNIQRIYTTGRKSYDLYQKYLYPSLGIEAIYLPSTSPLNARMKLEDLISIYQDQLFLKSKRR